MKVTSGQNVYLRFHPDFFQRNEFTRLFVQGFVHDTVRSFADLFQLVVIDIDADVPRGPFLDEIPGLQRALQQLYIHCSKKYIQTHTHATVSVAMCRRATVQTRWRTYLHIVVGHGTKSKTCTETTCTVAGVAKSVGDNQKMAGQRRTNNKRFGGLASTSMANIREEGSVAMCTSKTKKRKNINNC